MPLLDKGDAGSNVKVILLLNTLFYKKNSVDPDGILHFAASHLGLHCLVMNLGRYPYRAQKCS